MKLTALLLCIALASEVGMSCGRKKVENAGAQDLSLRVKGVVLDKFGEPVEGAIVSWAFFESDHRPGGYRFVKGSKLNESRMWSQHLVTDRAGRFSAEDLGPGLLTLIAAKASEDGWGPQNHLGKETLELPHETEVVLSFQGLQHFEVFAKDAEGKALPSSFFAAMHTEDRVLELFATRRGIDLWTDPPSKADLYDSHGRGLMRIDLLRLGKWHGGFHSPESNVELGRLSSSFGDYIVRNRPGTHWLISGDKPIARADYEAGASYVRLPLSL